MAGDTERYRFDVSLEDLQTFLAVTEFGSFSTAAKRLHLSQPSISNRIRRLEEKLHTRLMNRSTRKIELTAQGQRLYMQSSETLARLRQLMGEFRGEAAARAREVHVAATMMVASLGLPYLIRLFHEKHANVRAIVFDLFPQEVINEVIGGNCDLAVMSLSHPVEGIRFEPLFEDTCVVVTQLNHPLLRHDAASLAEVLKEPLLNPQGLHDLSSAVEAEAGRHGLLVNLAPEAQGVRNTFTLLAMAAAGLGVCIHPRSFIPMDLMPTIGIVPLRDAAITRTFGLLVPDGRELGPAAKQFREFMHIAVHQGSRPWHPDFITPPAAA